MNLTEMENAVREAAAELRRADMVADSAARLILGRLRHVNSWTLKDLKRELSRYNTRTDKWK